MSPKPDDDKVGGVHEQSRRPGPRYSSRSHVLFLNADDSDQPSDVARRLLTRVHEQGHWVRYHGSSFGLWLTLLRRTRDAFAREWMTEQLSSRQRRAAQRWRDAGRPLIQFTPDGLLSSWLDQGRAYDPADPGWSWACLRQTHRMLEDANSLERGAAPGKGMLIDALVLSWMNEDAFGGLPFPKHLENNPDARPEDLVLDEIRHFRAWDGSKQFLSAKLLSECASVIDENLLLETLPDLDPLDAQVCRRKLEPGHLYGDKLRLIRDFADYEVSLSTALALIDYALNPVIPSVHPGAVTLSWQQVYPPYRLAMAAGRLRYYGRPQLPDHPDAKELRDFQRKLEAVAPMGRSNHHRVPPGRKLSEVVLDWPADSATGAFHAVAAHAGSQLFAYRQRYPHLVCQVSSQLLRPDGQGDPATWPGVLFPPLQEQAGVLHHRGDLDVLAAGTLLESTVAACAIDDVLTGTGPLTRGHLPAMLFEPESAHMLARCEELVTAVTGIRVPF